MASRTHFRRARLQLSLFLNQQKSDWDLWRNGSALLKGNQEGEARLWIAPSVEATLQRHIHIFLSNLATKSQHHHAFITLARNLALSWALTQPQFIQGDVERPRTFVLSMMRESIQLGFLHIPRSTATR